jgi:ABC-2 type transport system permease protein
MNYYFKKSIQYLIISLFIVIAVNFVANKLFFRIDLTAEKRYTLTNATKNLLKNIKQEIVIDVYLDGKDLPAGIKKLKQETGEMLQEFRTYSKGKIVFNYIDINQIKKAEDKETKMQELVEKGIKPINLEVNTNSGFVEKLIFPGAILKSNNREIPVQILESQFAFGAQGAINNSVNFLEYKLANAIQKLSKTKAPKVVFLQGHGELQLANIQEILKYLTQQNFIVDKIELGTEPLLNNDIDILVIAKPQQSLLEEEKFLIDQFVMHGGKVIWLIDNSTADLQNFQQAPTYVATARTLNIEDLLFRYGVRINYNLVLDLYCSQIPIIETIGGNPQPKLFPWVFFPISIPKNNHPIIKNLDPIWFRFPNSIDILNNPNIEKTILATTSTYSRVQSLPFEIHLLGAKQKPNPNLFNAKEVPLAVLLEGTFSSLYTNQFTSDLKILLGKQNATFIAKSMPNKMIVIADGDIIANDLDSKGMPLALGYDRYTQKQYANKEFILNCFEYLVDDNNLIEARNREVKMRLLDKAKIIDQKQLAQITIFFVPTCIIIIFGIMYNNNRKRKYTK